MKLSMYSILLPQILVSFAALADVVDVPFPKYGGYGRSGDIASDVAWSIDKDGTVTPGHVPGPNERPAFQWDNVSTTLGQKTVLTCSTNSTFTGLYFHYYDATRQHWFLMDLDKSDNPTITMNGDLVISEYSLVRMWGGVYDFQGLHRYDMGDWNSDKHRSHIRLELDKGCVWTNMSGTVALSYCAGGDTQWRLLNGSEIHALGDFELEHYASTTNNLVEILSGSKLVVGGTVKDVIGVSELGKSTAGRYLVSGEGSLLSANSIAIGLAFDDNEIVVTNGGRITASAESYIGYSTFGERNAIRIKDGGSARLASIYLAYHQGGHNVYEVSSGGVSTNVTVYTGYNNLLKVASTGNVFRVTGPDARADVLGSFFLGSRMAFDDRVEVLDGGLMTLTNLFVSCGAQSSDCGVVVSNATLEVFNKFESGSSINGAAYNGGTNGFLRFQGDHPRMIVDHASVAGKELKNGLRFVFELPIDGYQEGVIPFTSYGWRTFDDTVRFEAEGLDAVVARMRELGIRKRTFHLMKSFNNVYSGLGKAVLDASNAALVVPDDVTAQFVYESPRLYEGTEICNGVDLEVKVHRGMTLIFR